MAPKTTTMAPDRARSASRPSRTQVEDDVMPVQHFGRGIIFNVTIGQLGNMRHAFGHRLPTEEWLATQGCRKL